MYFDTSKSNIGADEQPKVDHAIELLKAAPASTKVNVVGHADVRGDKAKNQALSEARTQTVVDAINTGIGCSVVECRVHPVFRGATKPVADLAKSRRVTIDIK